MARITSRIGESWLAIFQQCMSGLLLTSGNDAEEGVTLQSGAMETLGKVAGGDMRKAITTLQSAVRLRVSSICTSQHAPEHLAFVSGSS